MDRQVVDLGTARDEEAQAVDEWDYLYIGDCDGDVTIKVGSKSKSPLNPEEFNKLENIKNLYYIYLTNTAQTGRKLVLYFEIKKRWWKWK